MGEIWRYLAGYQNESGICGNKGILSNSVENMDKTQRICNGTPTEPQRNYNGAMLLQWIIEGVGKVCWLEGS